MMGRASDMYDVYQCSDKIKDKESALKEFGEKFMGWPIWWRDAYETEHGWIVKYNYDGSG